jgi:hypothetical protein
MRSRTAVVALAVAGMLSLPAIGNAASSKPTTAWRDGALRVDTPGVVSRSDLVLERPPWRSEQSMPLGNGHLGAAVWAADGFTAQLNRNDTFPDLKSAGQLVIPGLFPLASAPDYRGRLGLYDAQLVSNGNGMSARTYVRADEDQLVVEVAGADPGQVQTADLRLWQGRTPATYAEDDVAALAETFTDAQSGTTTGAVAALTARARDVSAAVVDEHTVRLSFKPDSDGGFRIVVGVPAYTGGDVGEASREAVSGAEQARIDEPHLAWWHRFWAGAAPMKVSSLDGEGEYMEALRAQQLYTTASTQRSSVPTGQAGAANMLYPWEDHAISPSFWFHFNLRQQVFANFGADTEEFNAPYLHLYADRLAPMRDWTRAHWPEADGVGVPELLRFDGTAGACDSSEEPAFLNRIVTGGLEVAHDYWLQYRYTGDRSILEQGFPLMDEVARFYLSLLHEGDDGYLHLEHVNSLETQWDTTDPTPDLAAMRVMFPIIANLAEEHDDAALAARLRAAIPKLPPFRTVTRDGAEVVAWSARDEPGKNTQNPEMETLLPWGRFGADSTLMQDTFRKRVFPPTREWNEDSTWATRLGLAGEMKRLLVAGTKDLQKFPNGFTGHGRNDDPARIRNYYSSWGGVVAASLQEGLVQSYQGIVRVARGWPNDWDVDGSVQIEGGHRVSTQVRDGVPNHVGIQARAADTLKFENPWPREAVRIVDGAHPSDAPIVRPTRDRVVQFAVERGRSYLVERVDQPYSSYRFEGVSGAPAAEVKHLGDKTLGVADSTPQIRSDLVSVVKPQNLHALTRAHEGVRPYVDRSDVITDLPALLARSVLIRGANDDSAATQPEDYLAFDLARPATVYVAFDRRGEGKWWPDWLAEQGYIKTAMTIQPREFLRRLELVDGRLRVSGGGVTLTRDGADWGDQIVEMTVRQIQVGAGLMFKAPDRNNGYVWQIGGPLGSPGGLGQLRMSTLVSGGTNLIDSVFPINPAPGNEYRVRVEAIGNRIRTFIDGVLVDERQDDAFTGGRIGFRMGGSDIGEFDDIRVTTPDGKLLFEDNFSGDLSQWDIPEDRQDVPLVVFKKQMPAGRVALGPNSGVPGQGDASYITFVGDG